MEPSQTQTETVIFERVIQAIRNGLQGCIEPSNDPSSPSGSPVTWEDCLHFAEEVDLWRGKLPPARMRDVLYGLLNHLLKQFSGLARSASPDKSGNEIPDRKIVESFLRDAVIALGPECHFQTDKMAVFILVPATCGNWWNEAKLQESLQIRGIRFGIETNSIQSLLKNKEWDCWVRVALGNYPILGSDAYLEDPLYLLSPRVRSLQCRDAWEKRPVNLFFQVVKAGQTILEKIPIETGTPGTDIFGRTIESQSGMDVDLPEIENGEVDTEKQVLRSTVNGIAYTIQDRIIVTPIQTIPGPFSTKLEPEYSCSSILIKGSVISGAQALVKGDIAVLGSIEEAEMKSDGQFFCRGNIRGQGKTFLTAGKSLYAVSLENCTVRAGEAIISKGAILNSNILAKRVRADGPNGQILGGVINAWEDICAETLGSELGVKTELILGDEFLPLKEEVDTCSNELKNKKFMKNQLGKNLRALASEESSSNVQKNKMVKALQNLNKEILELQSRTDLAVRELSYSESCVRMVRARKAIYPGVTIRMMAKTFLVRELLGPVTIKIEGNRIQTFPYQERPWDRIEGDEK